MSKLSKVLQGLFALMLVLGVCTPVSAPSQPTEANIHPQIHQIASENPNQLIAVIIQKADRSKQAEQVVEQLGGTITKDLNIINAFAAELPAKQVTKLIKLASVSWVSLDAPTVNVSHGGNTDKRGSDQHPNSNAYLDTIGVTKLQARRLLGDGVTVAILDSGIPEVADLMDHRSGEFRLLDWIQYTGTGEADFQDTFFDSLDAYRVTERSWETFEIEADVPEGAGMISFGLFLAGSGAVWLDAVSIEEVGR